MHQVSVVAKPNSLGMGSPLPTVVDFTFNQVSGEDGHPHPWNEKTKQDKSM